MNNKANRRLLFKVVTHLSLLISSIVLISCSERQAGESARSGQMTLALDRQFGDIAGRQAEYFTRYYPDARITLKLSASGKTLKHVLERNARAALISGKIEAGEDSLFSKGNHPLRCEPVAIDAIVCIVNRKNPLSSLSKKDLVSFCSGKEINGENVLLTADDYRLQSVLAANLGINKKNLRARGCSSETELIKRVSNDTKAVGLLFLSSLYAVHGEGIAQQDFKIIPLAQDSALAHPYMPTQQTIFEGRYPLITIVYYVYYSGDALAAGFGSWLTSSGQKIFEKSSLAPYRPIERTIILK